MHNFSAGGRKILHIEGQYDNQTTNVFKRRFSSDGPNISLIFILMKKHYKHFKGFAYSSAIIVPHMLYNWLCHITFVLVAKIILLLIYCYLITNG